MVDAYFKGESFSALLNSYQRPLFLLAHHDDEISSAGLLQRLVPGVRVLWVTNSDGLYFESDLEPAPYGEVRKREGLVSLEKAGIPASQARCLDFSEVEIYRAMARLYESPDSLDQVWPLFAAIRDAVRESILALEPDLVVTLAWQGGQPEHDLTHFFGKLALDSLARATGSRAAFFHVPAYEYTIVLAQRFHPLYHGERLRLRLSEEELATKLEMIKAYPSQKRLFGDFERVFQVLGPVARLRGYRSVEDYLAVEEFGPVPSDLDYLAKPHFLDFFTYMFDDFEGTPVTFSRSVRPVVARALEEHGLKP